MDVNGVLGGGAFLARTLLAISDGGATDPPEPARIEAVRTSRPVDRDAALEAWRAEYSGRGRNIDLVV